MRQTLFHWCCLLTAVASLAWTGCASSTRAGRAVAASNVGSVPVTATTPAALASPTLPSAPPADYSAEYASRPVSLPSYLQPAPACGSGFS